MEVSFTNSKNITLKGILDEADQPIVNAVFAHCFTCSKDHPASYRLCKAFTKVGIQVLRFDFMGLGDSQGEFTHSNFSSNIDDITAAIEFLNTRHTAPKLIIGHSLGGIAALAAACQIDSIEAVATIAAPSRPSHVLEHFKQYLPKIRQDGSTDIKIFEQTLTLTNEYINDLESYDKRKFTSKLNKPLLIFHSPYDDIVSVDEAAKIFIEAKHPKSFISLDKIDHLISKKKDAEYIANVIACWLKHYL